MNKLRDGLIKMAQIRQWCEECNSFYEYDETNVDILHECNSGDTATDQEDVIVYGDYVDENTGSTVNVTPNWLQTAGIADTNKFDRSWWEGQDVNPKTERGRNAQIYRQRKRYIYKNFITGKETSNPGGQ